MDLHKSEFRILTPNHRPAIRQPCNFPKEQTLTTTPAVVHVVSLFVPLEPHAEAVLDESGHQTEATESGQNELGVSQKVLRYILRLRDQLVLIEVVHLGNLIR